MKQLLLIFVISNEVLCKLLSNFAGLHLSAYKRTEVVSILVNNFVSKYIDCHATKDAIVVRIKTKPRVGCVYDTLIETLII